MLKRLFLYVFFMVCIAGISAQTAAFLPESYWGINGGTTVSMVNFMPSVQQNYILGYSGGVVFRHNSQNHLGMQAELNFSQRGWSEQSGYIRQLNYIELPFMSHFYVGNKVQFFLNLGPKVSVLLNDNQIAAGNGAPTSEQYKAIQNPVDYGFCGGFGLQLKAGRQLFILDTRVNYSISTLFSDKLTEHFRNSNNMNAALTAAWLISTKK